MKKKWLALVLTGVLCFNLTGCNSDGKSEDSNSDYSAADALAEYKESKGKDKKDKEDVKEDTKENKDSKEDKESKKDEESGNNSDLYLVDEKTNGYTEITMYKSKFMVPDSVVESGNGLDDVVRFMDDEGTYDIKAQYCNNCFNEGDVEDVASNIEKYFLEDYDVVVDIDTDDCLTDTEDTKCKYIFPSVDFSGYDGSIAYLCDAGNDALLYVIEDGNVFNDKEKDIMLKSLDAYDGNEYTYATDMDTELIELETIEAETEEEQQDEDETAVSEGNPLTAYEMTINGQTLKLPMWYSDMVDAGWTLDGESGELAANTKTRIEFKNKKGNTLYADIVNFSMSETPYSECIVTRLEYNPYSYLGNSEKDIVELPSGITLYKSTYDDLLQAYGEPTRINEIDEDDEYGFVDYEVDYEHMLSFTFKADTNIVNEVTIKCEEALEGVSDTIINERPDIFDTYKAPKKLSDDLYDAIFELDEVMYQLPCPAEVFIENGWKIVDGADELVMPGSVEFGVIEKDGVTCDVTFKTPTKNALYPENTYIVGIRCRLRDGEKISYSINDDISLGKKMTIDELKPYFETMDVSVTESKDTQSIYADSTSDIESRVTYYIYIKDGVITSINVENNVYFER